MMTTRAKVFLKRVKAQADEKKSKLRAETTIDFGPEYHR